MQENKTKETVDQLKIKMRKGQIVVNNETVKQKVTPPQKSEILRLKDVELEQIRAVKIVKGPEHLEKGSEYFSYAAKVKTRGDVDRIYKKLQIKHADATHISCGYRLENPIGPYRQEAVDDKDIGIGRSILKVMKSKDLERMAVFVVRYYGNENLGKRRFEVAEFLADRAIQSWYAKDAKRRIQKRGSNSSVNSTATQQDSQDEAEDLEG